MNPYDPIDRWISQFSYRQQRMFSWLRAALVIGFFVMAFRGCDESHEVVPLR